MVPTAMAIMTTQNHHGAGEAQEPDDEERSEAFGKAGEQVIDRQLARRDPGRGNRPSAGLRERARESLYVKLPISGTSEARIEIRQEDERDPRSTPTAPPRRGASLRSTK